MFIAPAAVPPPPARSRRSTFDGVPAASPLYVDAERSTWRNPLTGLSRRIRVLAYPPGDDVLDLDGGPAPSATPGTVPDVALADELSKATLVRPAPARHRLRAAGQAAPDRRDLRARHRLPEQRHARHERGELPPTLPERRGGSWGETAIDVGVLRPGRVPTSAACPGEPAGRVCRADVIVLTQPELLAKEQAFWEKRGARGRRLRHRRGDGLHRRPGDLLPGPLQPRSATAWPSSRRSRRWATPIAAVPGRRGRGRLPRAPGLCGGPGGERWPLHGWLEDLTGLRDEAEGRTGSS